MYVALPFCMNPRAAHNPIFVLIFCWGRDTRRLSSYRYRSFFAYSSFPIAWITHAFSVHPASILCCLSIINPEWIISFS